MVDRRALNIERLKSGTWDVLILGGGINGAGIARDLTLRGAGLRVGLVEKNHFASGTSGKNSQLIHGGLRYLKYLEFDLVHEALRERATLLRIAPGLVKPLDFLIPCFRTSDLWLYGLGLSIYDVLGGSGLRGHHRRLGRSSVSEREPHLTADGLQGAISYWDCQVNSARLVIENLLDAEERGAAIANYVEARVERRTAHCRDTLSGEEFDVRARLIVDATGAWSNGAPLRLVRGSHLIFSRIQNKSEAIAHFDDQGRIVFLIPWGEDNNLTLVGTTDVEHTGSPDDVHITADEREYLQGVVRRLFPSYREEPIGSYSALRPLIAEPGRSVTSNSRRHRIWQTPDGVLHIAGGKYTTYRAMSEELVDRALAEVRPGAALPCRTADVPFRIPERPGNVAARVRLAVEREYARHLTDLLCVSTYWGYERALSLEWIEPLASQVAELLDWDAARIAQESRSVITDKPCPV